jgi:hypothetical protein
MTLWADDDLSASVTQKRGVHTELSHSKEHLGVVASHARGRHIGGGQRFELRLAPDNRSPRRQVAQRSVGPSLGWRSGGGAFIP